MQSTNYHYHRLLHTLLLLEIQINLKEMPQDFHLQKHALNYLIFYDRPLVHPFLLHLNMTDVPCPESASPLYIVHYCISDL